MKNVISVVLLAACIVISGLTGCDSVTYSSDNPDIGTPAATSRATETAPTVVSPTITDTPSPTENPPAIPAGSLALFATLSGGSESDFLRVNGGRVSWDTTHYKLLRYIPEIAVLDEFGWTSSKSYSKSYVYGITDDEWVYEVKCFTDSGRKDITRLDPKTGDTVGRFGSFTTGDMYRGFTISGDRVIYRSKISKDLFGKRTGGGNVMAMEIGSSSAVALLDYYDDNNKGQYFGIGDELITVVRTYGGADISYDIYRVDPASMAIGDLLYSFASQEITFHEGDTSLFWSEKDPDTGNVNIIRFPLSEYPEYYLEISESTPELLTIDESRGKVLITFRDDTPESPFYYLADIATDNVIELDVEPAFFSKSIYGNGQFCILE